MKEEIRGGILKTTNQLVIERIKKLAQANYTEGQRRVSEFKIDTYPWLYFGLNYALQPCTLSLTEIKNKYKEEFKYLLRGKDD